MRAFALGTDSPRARTTDPITSHEAADATVGKVAASQAIVYRILSDSPDPLTDEQIWSESSHYGTWSYTRIRTARGELVAKGLVRAVGVVTPDGHRTRMTTWGLA